MRTVNTNTHTNDETEQVAYTKDNDSDSDNSLNCNMEYSDFVVDDEDFNSLHEKEDERNLMSKE